MSMEAIVKQITIILEGCTLTEAQADTIRQKVLECTRPVDPIPSPVDAVKKVRRRTMEDVSTVFQKEPVEAVSKEEPADIDTTERRLRNELTQALTSLADAQKEIKELKEK